MQRDLTVKPAFDGKVADLCHNRRTMSASWKTPQFVFLLSQPASTAWLKADLQKNEPSFTFAFSRKGLLTYKSKSGALSLETRPKTVFAYHDGFSLGQASTVEDVRALLGESAERLRLHVYGRDDGEGKAAVVPSAIDELRRQLLGSAPGRFHDDPNPKPGERVLDVIVPPEGEKTEPWFVGWHPHTEGRSGAPGGVTRTTPPDYAPSRAWSKLEELLTWSSVKLVAGQHAVEIGCAPGGAIVNLLERGLHVIGIDPGDMDPRVEALALNGAGSFTHLKLPIGAVKREQLPARVDFLLCDANLAPTVMLRYLSHWSKQLRPHLRGILFTLKLNDDSMVAALPKLLARCGELGFGAPRAVQLPSHRREIAVVCVRR